jgi:hypothetical protein
VGALSLRLLRSSFELIFKFKSDVIELVEKRLTELEYSTTSSLSLKMFQTKQGREQSSAILGTYNDIYLFRYLDASNLQAAAKVV